MPQTARLARARVREVEPRTNLRVVPAPGRRGRSRRTVRRAASSPRRVADARVRAVFTSCVALLVALTGVSLVRVAVVARAAEMTITAERLTQRIKDQRIQADALELDRSSLQKPSRIDGIASETMEMGTPASVRYISLSASEGEAAGSQAAQMEQAPAAETVQSGQQAAAGGSDPLAEAWAAVVRMSAGEAQALLLGDIGLAGSR